MKLTIIPSKLQEIYAIQGNVAWALEDGTVYFDKHCVFLKDGVCESEWENCMQQLIAEDIFEGQGVINDEAEVGDEMFK